VNHNINDKTEELFREPEQQAWPRKDFDNTPLARRRAKGPHSTSEGQKEKKGKVKGWQNFWQQPQPQRSQGGKGGRGKPWRSNSGKPPEKI